MIELKADCQKCAALCCLALAFDKSKMFAIDKKNGEACPNLEENSRCSIHPELQAKGFGGCVQYDCNGAGQRVTQDLFGGRSWQSEDRLRMPMMRAFESMCRVHELLVLLNEAKKLKLDGAHTEALKNFEAALNPKHGWSKAALEDFSLGQLEAEILGFFKSLRAFV